MFPNRNSFYTYAGLTDAMAKFPDFAGTGDEQTRKRELAAFLANVDHESGGLVHVEEINRAAWGNYCDAGQPYGCPAGQTAYHGRGPIQLSWNTNYKAAGDALGIDLLNKPGPGGDRPVGRVADRALVLDDPEGCGNDDGARGDDRRGWFRRDHPDHQRCPGVRWP